MIVEIFYRDKSWWKLSLIGVRDLVRLLELCGVYDDKLSGGIFGRWFCFFVMRMG